MYRAKEYEDYGTFEDWLIVRKNIELFCRFRWRYFFK